MRRGRSVSWLVLFSLCFLVGCAERGGVAPEKLVLRQTFFTGINGWHNDALDQAVPAFLKSCFVFKKKDLSTRFGLAEAGSIKEWLPACRAAEAQDLSTPDKARAFFETYFTPYAVQNQTDGLFTGYYEASLRGSWARGGAYQTPLWKRPKDMLTIELGAFRDAWVGQKITGKIAGPKFIPYDDRAAIAAGSLSDRAEALLWVDDPVDAFFLEIQGSGQVRMTDGSVVRVGYDAQNGHGYTPIGRVLADRGEIEKPVTMAKIRTWLAAHPAQAQEIMNQNESVIFFHKTDRAGAIGAQGIELTPMRSMAVDTNFVPLGVPLFLSSATQHRLVVAQDTGGAIKGAVRGDLFWGAGVEAEAGAGPMQEAGTYYLLLPRRGVAP